MPGTLSVACEHRVSSQNGEDGVLGIMLLELGVTEPTFVEFGAADGVEGNCVLLADFGARGVFIERDLNAFSKLSQRWAGHDNITLWCDAVNAENVNDVFADAGVPVDVTIMSVDIDGNDYWVWDAVAFVSPLIVVIEYNSWLVGKCVQPYDPWWRWDGTDFFGASLAALIDLGRRKGYTFVYAESAGVNAFFVRDDHADVFGAPSSDVIGLHRHPRDPLGREYEMLA